MSDVAHMMTSWPMICKSISETAEVELSGAIFCIDRVLGCLSEVLIHKFHWAWDRLL